MGKGTIYVDYLSQPCRALGIINRAAKLGAQEKTISLFQGEHKKEEYKKVNPSTKVPAYVSEDGWSLTESVAITRYLCLTAEKLDDHWYPADPRSRARVDEYLAWQHAGMRAKAMPVFIAVVFEKMRNNGVVNTETLREKIEALEKSLTEMENHFLKDRDFVAGSEISIADLFGVCEIVQPISAGYDISKRHPKVAAWINRVKAATQPHFDELTQVVTKFAAEHKYNYEPLMPAK